MLTAELSTNTDELAIAVHHLAATAERVAEGFEGPGPATWGKCVLGRSEKGLGRCNGARYTVSALYAAHLTMEGC